jgi:carbamate kinase
MLVVVALGGNALLRRGEAQDAATMRRNAATAAGAIAALVDAGHRVVVTHGNGPQVGLLALQAAAYGDVEPYPLDILDAESEGMIGYVLDQELLNRVPGTDVVTILTQIAVDPDDPAFGRPVKPIGPVYPAGAADDLARKRGWTLAADGDGVRRVVPSPAPVRIIELPTIRLLVRSGVLVVCSGGGGIAVVAGPCGLEGVEGVIDKDAAAALLAGDLDADALLLLTDVDGVYDGWGTPDQRRVDKASPPWLRARAFAAGSMGPKVAAACAFVDNGGAVAAIGRLADAVEVLAGTAGTRVVSEVT